MRLIHGGIFQPVILAFGRGNIFPYQIAFESMIVPAFPRSTHQKLQQKYYEKNTQTSPAKKKQNTSAS